MVESPEASTRRGKSRRELADSPHQIRFSLLKNAFQKVFNATPLYFRG